MPKALPGEPATPTPTTGSATTASTKSGTVTLRVAGQLRHIGIGRTHDGTHVILLIQDLQVRVVNAITGELLRELTIDPNKNYQPTGAPNGPTQKDRDPDLSCRSGILPMS